MKKFTIRLVFFLTVGLILVLCIEVCCRFVLKIPKIQSFLNVEKMDQLINKIDDQTILIVGDSRLEWGLKPLTIDSVLNHEFPRNKCLNLAMINNNGISSMEFLIKEKKFPKYFIYNYNIVNFRYKNLTFNHYPTGVHRQLAVWKNKFLEMIFRNSLFLESKWESITNYLAHNVSIYLKVWYDQSGGCYVVESTDYQTKKLAQINGYKDPLEHFPMDRFLNYSRSLSACIDSFRLHGTKIIQIRMPICKDLQRMEDLPVTYETTDSYYKDYLLDFSGYAVKNNFKEEDFFFDGSHVCLKESFGFSTAVANELLPVLKKANP